MWRRAKWENKCIRHSEIRKHINKIGGNICGDRILCRVDETQVSDTPAEEEKLKIGEEKWNHKRKLLLKDSDNGGEIVPQRKKGYIQENSVMDDMEEKRETIWNWWKNIWEAVSKLEENVRKGKVGK